MKKLFYGGLVASVLWTVPAGAEEIPLALRNPVEYCNQVATAASLGLLTRMQGELLETTIKELVYKRQMELVDPEYFIVLVSQYATAYALPEKFVQNASLDTVEDYKNQTRSMCNGRFN